MTEAAFDWRPYYITDPFPDTNGAEAVADAAAGTSTAKGGEDASSPLPRFRNHPDEVDYLMGKGRQVMKPEHAMNTRDKASWYLGVANVHFSRGEMPEALFYAQVATAYAALAR